MGKRWEHFCEPLKINAHNEMSEFPKGVEPELQEVDIPIRSVTTYGADIRTLPSPSSPQDFETEVQIDFRLPTNLRGKIKELRFDVNRHQIRERLVGTALVAQLLYIDWGVRPQDASIAKQRTVGDFSELLCANWCKQLHNDRWNYMPKTRKDLTKWAQAHWGKRGDGAEFCEEMVNCLDYEKLRIGLPDPGAGARSRSPWERVSLRQEAARQNLITAGCHAAQVGRWAEMFKEAPNTFWAAQN